MQSIREIKEGKIIKGGVNEKPKTEKPNFNPPPQKLKKVRS